MQVLHMCNAFQEEGADVTLAIPKSKSSLTNLKIIQNELENTVKFKILEYKKYTLFDRPMTLGSYWGVNSILKNKDYDYCFVRNFYLARLALSRGLKTIYEEHDKKLHPNKILNILYTKKMLESIPYIIKMIVISQALADVWIKKGVPSTKIITLHDCASIKDYENVITRAQARKKLEIKTQNKVVMYVGSLYKDRGIETILKLAGSFSQVSFIVVGGTEKEKNAYQSKVLKLNLQNVTFTGRVPHCRVKEYLYAADVLLMLWSEKTPTIDICSPLKLFEYMASERIIVGYGFETIKEICTDERTAFLAKPCSYIELEDKLRKAVELDYPNELAANARKLVFEKFNWQNRARQILDFLK